jgi:flagellar protein FliS
MPVASPYNKMLESAIMTASREELTLMLYDGAIKFCNQSLVALKKDDLEASTALIIRVEDIIREFQITLDHSYDISRQLNSLYDYMYRRLVEANMNKDPEILEEVLGMLRELRDTWKDAMKLARQQQ